MQNVKMKSNEPHRSPDRWWCRLWRLFLSKEHRWIKGLTNWNGILMRFHAFSIFLEAPKTPHQLPFANFTLVWWWKQMSRSQGFSQSKPQPSKRDERKQHFKKKSMRYWVYCTHHTSPQMLIWFFDIICLKSFVCCNLFSYIPSAFQAMSHPLELWSQIAACACLESVQLPCCRIPSKQLQNLWVESFLRLAPTVFGQAQTLGFCWSRTHSAILELSNAWPQQRRPNW